MKTVETRREFMKKVTATPVAMSALGLGPRQAAVALAQASSIPWYRRALRWGQTNINEMDPLRYDIEWWRQHWKRTRVRGVIINAAGIVAYYPSKFPLHYRAQHLGDRDLYGELVRAAHEDGLAVLARMDSNRTREEFYKAQPDWFALDIEGQPYRAAERYVTCIDSPYYEEYLPSVLREIIEWEKPEGFTDNSWSGLSREQICYCRYSQEKFRQATGKELPRKKDWDDPVYREWIKWSYARRTEIWDLNNRTVREAGGPDCLWMGMLHGDFVSAGGRFRDLNAICERAEMIMVDNQGRNVQTGFQKNAEIGKRLHGLLGWDKLMPQALAMYQRNPVSRKVAASKPDTRMWMISGIAGNILPWWHHVGAYQWDRRQFKTAEPLWRWHEANEQYLVNRYPVASVGVVYSQENADFYGRDEARERVGYPYDGIMQALVRSRIPYLPVHADHIDREGKNLAGLILPNMAAMSESQVASVRRFVQNGGALLATGETSLYDEWGDPRQDFALADLFGAHFTGNSFGTRSETPGFFEPGGHTCLRLHPDVGREVYGPRAGHEPVVSGQRHPVLEGFEDTDILAFGGFLLEVKAEPTGIVPMTYIPHFPVYPPETSWMRIQRTDTPALVLMDPPNGPRRVYFPADVDRRFAFSNLPDHGDLLANLIRWSIRDDVPLEVKGPGLIDCNLYRQPGRQILHLVNLTSSGTWRSPIHELVSIGPFEVSVRLAEDVKGSGLRLLVSGEVRPTAVRDGWAGFEVSSIMDHEVAVIE